MPGQTGGRFRPCGAPRPFPVRKRSKTAGVGKDRPRRALCRIHAAPLSRRRVSARLSIPPPGLTVPPARSRRKRASAAFVPRPAIKRGPGPRLDPGFRPALRRPQRASGGSGSALWPVGVLGPARDLARLRGSRRPAAAEAPGEGAAPGQSPGRVRSAPGLSASAGWEIGGGD